MKSRNCILHAIALIVLLESCGRCLILPMGYHERGDQFAETCVDTGKVDAVKPKVATRDQVSRDLGPPTVAFNDERLWVYCWVVQREFHVLWAVTSLESSAGGVWQPDGDSVSYLLLEFDDHGVVQRKRIKHGGYLKDTATTIDDAFR